MDIYNISPCWRFSPIKPSLSKLHPSSWYSKFVIVLDMFLCLTSVIEMISGFWLAINSFNSKSLSLVRTSAFVNITETDINFWGLLFPALVLRPTFCLEFPFARLPFPMGDPLSQTWCFFCWFSSFVPLTFLRSSFSASLSAGVMSCLISLRTPQVHHPLPACTDVLWLLPLTHCLGIVQGGGGVRTTLDPHPHRCHPVRFAYGPSCPVSLPSSEGPHQLDIGTIP